MNTTARSDMMSPRVTAPAPSESAGPRAKSMRAQLRGLVGDQRRRIALLAVLAVISAITEAVNLALIAQIATALVKANKTHLHLTLLHIHAPTKTLIIAALLIALVRLPLLQLPLSLLPARIIADVWARIRADLFRAYTGSSWEVQSREREGQLQEIMTNQSGQATQGAVNLLSLITSSLTFLVFLAFAFALDLFAAVIVVALAISMLALLRPLRGMGRRRARSLSQAQLSYAAGIAESIRVAEETQVFGTAAAQRQRIGARVDTARKFLFETQLLTKIGSNISQSFVYLMLVGGLFLIRATGDKDVGSLGAVVLILVRASSSGQNIQSSYQGLIQAMPFVERTQETERRYREGTVRAGTQRLAHVAALAFDGVGYSYRPGRPVLSDIRFEVERGEVVGVIGPSGAGKSTLVQLLLRLRAPNEGRYLVDGIEAQEIAPAEWRRLASYVPQEPRLLHASVAENIRYFRKLDLHEVERAARLARIHDDIMGWSDGYETVVGPRADAVSGGQQQRICLARALVARPEILVLDEPTSALDPTSESLIQESLTGLKGELTLFIVAHRMSTLDICDRVMIIIDGKLTAFDTIGDLEQHNSYYRTASALATGGVLP